MNIKPLLYSHAVKSALITVIDYSDIVVSEYDLKKLLSFLASRPLLAMDNLTKWSEQNGVKFQESEHIRKAIEDLKRDCADSLSHSYDLLNIEYKSSNENLIHKFLEVNRPKEANLDVILSEMNVKNFCIKSIIETDDLVFTPKALQTFIQGYFDSFMTSYYYFLMEFSRQDSFSRPQVYEDCLEVYSWMSATLRRFKDSANQTNNRIYGLHDVDKEFNLRTANYFDSISEEERNVVRDIVRDHFGEKVTDEHVKQCFISLDRGLLQKVTGFGLLHEETASYVKKFLTDDNNLWHY